MKLEKKLESFSRYVMNEAEAQRRNAAREMDAAFGAAVDEAARAAAKHADEFVRSERYRIDKTKNKNITAASAQAKRSLIGLREQLTDELFERVRADVADFAESGAYEDYLISAIGAASREADGFFGYAQVSEKDMRLAGRIEAETGLMAEAAGDIVLGGFKLVSRDRRAVSDDTLDARLIQERLGFSVLASQDMANMAYPNGGAAGEAV